MPRTVLYVEDDPNDVFLMERIFRQSAPTLELKVLNSGSEATAFLSSDFESTPNAPIKPSLVLLDINLPGQSGLEVLNEIRSKKALKYIPVIMFTSSNQATDIARAYERGCSGYVIKPQGTDNLKDVVSTLTSFWLRDNEYPPV